MRHNTNPTGTKKQETPPLRASIQLAILDAASFVIFIWILYVSFTDESGWSGLITVPVYIFISIILISAAVGYVVLAIKARKSRRKLALYLVAALVSLWPIIFTVAYDHIDESLRQAAMNRSNTPISLQEAKRLVTTCEVETMQRDDGGQLQLNSTAPALPTEQSYSESRSFDVGYYDELFALARSKDVESRCGFVPTYDIERSKQPEVNKWITENEAKDIIGKCLWSTQLSVYYPGYAKIESAGPNSTGILLSQKLGVWNDDTESTITVINADTAIVSLLRAEQQGCRVNQ